MRWPGGWSTRARRWWRGGRGPSRWGGGAARRGVGARAITLAAEIAEKAPLAVTATRATMRAELAKAVKKQTDHEFAEQEKLRGTEDFQEGRRAGAARR